MLGFLLQEDDSRARSRMQESAHCSCRYSTVPSKQPNTKVEGVTSRSCFLCARQRHSGLSNSQSDSAKADPTLKCP